MSLHTITGNFYLLDGRSPSHEHNRYAIGDSYYYSKLLCTENYVNKVLPDMSNSTKLVSLR